MEAFQMFYKNKDVENVHFTLGKIVARAELAGSFITICIVVFFVKSFVGPIISIINSFSMIQ